MNDNRGWYIVAAFLPARISGFATGPGHIIIIVITIIFHFLQSCRRNSNLRNRIVVSILCSTATVSALNSSPVHRRSVVPWSVHWRCRPSKSPRTSLFLQRLPRPASGSPLHCWQPSISGCWPSGIGLSATRGYVGNVSGDLTHSSRLKTFLFTEIRLIWHLHYIHTVHSRPSSVFNN